MKKEPMKAVTIRMPETVHEKLRQRAFSLRRSINSLLVVMIEKECKNGK